MHPDDAFEKKSRKIIQQVETGIKAIEASLAKRKTDDLYNALGFEDAQAAKQYINGIQFLPEERRRIQAEMDAFDRALNLGEELSPSLSLRNKPLPRQTENPSSNKFMMRRLKQAV